MKTCEKFSGYQALAEAIIVQAGIDYLDTKRLLENDISDGLREALNNELESIRCFFRSKWYVELTDTNPEWMFAKLDEGYEVLKQTNNLNRIKQLQRV